MIEGRLAGSDTFGAGVIFGASGEMVYIATANHVVRKGTKEVEDLQVRLRSLPGQALPGILLDDWSAEDDLAVIGVRSTESRRIDLDSIRFDLVGDAQTLERREDSVFHVGFPLGKRWHVPVRPDPISGTSATEIVFESQRVEPGSSGGGLFTEQWQLVGLVQRVGALEARALRIERALELLDNWGYAIRLGAGQVAIVPPRSAPEILEFSAEPLSVEPDQRVTLRWRTRYAETVELDGSAVSAEGFRIEYPSSSRTYRLVAESPGFSQATKSLSVEVRRVPRISYFRAASTRIDKGKEVVLSWSIENAKEARLEGAGTARSVSLVGSSTERPSRSSTYTLRAWSFDGQEVSQQLTVDVLDTCSHRSAPAVQLRHRSVEVSSSQLRSIVAQRGFTAVLANRSGGYDPPVYGSFRNDFRPVEGAVVDCATGLMWQRDNAGPFLPSEAESYIAERNRSRVGGHSDWRIPTIEELMSLTQARGRQTRGLNTPLHLDSSFSDHYYCMSNDRVPYNELGQEGVWSITWAGPGSLGMLPATTRYPVKAVRTLD